jgi:hemolysin III
MQNTHILSKKYREMMVEKLRDPISGLSHLAAALLALVGLAWLLYLGRENPTKEAALLIYGISLVAMFSASATYHLVKAGPEIILRLRKLDHSAIFLLIAGTYTPICIYFFSGFFQWGLPVIVWTMAITGVTIKMFMIKAPRWITAGIYLAMGWICILAIGQMVSGMPAGAIAWLIAGGLAYSVGAVVYIAKKPDFYPEVFGFHELWHIFVILGALAHFILIAVYIAPI